jgi:hypothetical protein
MIEATVRETRTVAFVFGDAGAADVLPNISLTK